MLLLRKILFIIFCLIYLILTPLIIARMLGFIIDPLTHHLVKTGLVLVSTNPPDAVVFMDGHLIDGKTPTIIRDLPPGEHFIRLELNGYKDWEGTIPVAPKKATVLQNTLLIPQQWPIKRISNKPYQNLIEADSGILVGVNHDLKNIDIFHTDEAHNAPVPLFAPHSIYADGQLIRIFNARQGPFILLELTVAGKHKFLWANVKENPPLIKDITDLSAKTPQKAAWKKPKPVFNQQTFLINNQSSLLIRDGSWIRIYPKAALGTASSIIIDKANPSTNMIFEEKNGKLFYLHRDNSFLYAVEILRPQALLNMGFAKRLQGQSL